MRLFFGGSFDPPHNGHRTLPDQIRGHARFDSTWLVYVPAARSPHKENPPCADQHRLAMLELLLEGQHRSSVWTHELDAAMKHPELPSYWASTWAHLRTLGMPGENRFLIGADQALAMHRWHAYEGFWRDALVMLRNDLDHPDELIAALTQCGVWAAEDLEHWRSSIITIPMVDASSTRIRRTLRDAGTRKNPIAGLDERVHEYILSNRLYLE